MKRKDLTAYIREQIIDELTETTYVGKGAKPTIQQDPKWSALKADAKKNALADLDKGGDVELEEADIDEMSRKAGGFKPGPKFKDAKEVYTTGLYANILKAIEEAGEKELTQNELGSILGVKNSSSLNPILINFRTVGILAGGPLAAAAKPEKGAKPKEPEVEEPETEEPEKDEWETPEEEEPETGEEEPTAVSDKEVEKTVGKAYAELSPEEEDVFNKFKQAIINKTKVLTDKKASKEDKTKAQAAIDNYKAKADLKKIFAKKGLNLIDFINGELKK